MKRDKKSSEVNHRTQQVEKQIPQEKILLKQQQNEHTISVAVKITEEQLSLIRNKMYHFITQYHLDNPEDETVFSAYSIFLTFAMLYPGADGETKSQLEKVFKFNEIKEDFENKIAFLLRIGKKEDENVRRYGDMENKDILRLENALWIDKKYLITKSYEKSINRMQSTMNSANFLTQSDDERIRINKYIEKITHNLIKDVLPPNSIDSLTRMIITNAMYFKSQWLCSFSIMKNGINFKDVGRVKSMIGSTGLKLTINDKFTIISIPYDNCNYYMTIIMPKDMKSFERSLDFKQINELIFNNLKKKGNRIELKMPLFKLEQTLNLKKDLNKLGLVDAFKISANFSNIFENVNNSDPLFIGDVIHKAFIDVNERETGAGAVTAIRLRGGGYPPPIEGCITIDKPFFSIISGIDALPFSSQKLLIPNMTSKSENYFVEDDMKN